jgi:hypothetical protein
LAHDRRGRVTGFPMRLSARRVLRAGVVEKADVLDRLINPIINADLRRQQPRRAMQRK